MEGRVVEFDNTPFHVSAIRKMECQFGSHYYKSQCQGRSHGIHLQGTRKVGCTAHITVRTITLPRLQN